MSVNVFNYDKATTKNPLLFLGEKQGLLIRSTKHYPKIWELYNAKVTRLG